MVAVFLGDRMALFNHEVEYHRFLSNVDPLLTVLTVRLSYDDAFDIRRNIDLPFPNDIDHIVIGGTASTEVTVMGGMVTELHDARVVVIAEDGLYYTCIWCRDDAVVVGQGVNIVEHLDHVDLDMSTFNWLATSRTGNFTLHSIKVTAYNSDNEDLEYVNIDPFTGQVNNNGRR